MVLMNMTLRRLGVGVNGRRKDSTNVHVHVQLHLHADATSHTLTAAVLCRRYRGHKHISAARRTTH